MHPHDGNLHALANMPEAPDGLGAQAGDTCGRYHEPDEDAPKGYRPKPCDGTMFPDAGRVYCDVCFETV